MDAALQELADAIGTALPGAVTHSAIAFGELTLTSMPERILELLTYLRDDPDCRFVNFTDLAGADYPEREQRFDVVYHLLSPKHNRRLRVKVATDETTPLPSAIAVFPAATWFEREAY